ncbi:AMP-binding protein [Streptomyces stramineus]
MTDEERERILTDWNDTALATPEATFPQVFEERAARTPDATALVHGTTALTFAELNARANRLARALVERGAGPESLVALALPRSEESVVALLAVLKAGAASVPVDLEYPAERIALLLEDAAPRSSSPTPPPPEPCPQPVAPPGGDRRPGHGGTPARQPRIGGRARPRRVRHPHLRLHRRPKGVVIDHAGLRNLYAHHRAGLIARAEKTCEGRPLRVALTASLSFDTSWEGLLWMAAGHELHVIGDDIRRDAGAMARHITETGIDVLDITPTYAEQLVEAGLLTDPRHRPRVLQLGGEPTGSALWQRLRGWTA